MEHDSMAYENPWRPNYESVASVVWITAGTVAMGVNQLSNLPEEPFYWMGGICLVMAAIRLPQALRLYNLQRHLKGRKLEFIKLDVLVKYIKPKKKAIWLGHGYVWENRHAQRVFEILKRDWTSVVNNKENTIGQTWIHGVEPKEHDVYQDLEHSEGQNLIVGTTGAGKTRLFDLLISQAIMRGEAVIIIDPKGDIELRDNARRACIAAGDEHRFMQFHPAFPESSIRIDPLKNYTRVTELASRLAALIPSEAGADPFKSFGWQALNNICQALEMVDDSPNLIKLKRYLETGTQDMVVKAVESYAVKHLRNGKEKVDAFMKTVGSTPEKQARTMVQFYKTVIQPVSASSELEGLLSMYQHDKTHFSKMVANLLPIMNMLTAGHLASLLSPDTTDENDMRRVTDNKLIIQDAGVAYFGLDSLSDSIVGSAIGSLLLSDLVSVAGNRYNFGVDNKPVNIFVDEAAEVINEPTIQLLNKGRGAKMKVFIATQTIVDFEARLGSTEKARQVLGNLNNIYALRVIDPGTQEFITENLPKTRLKSVMRTQGLTSQTESPLMFTANTGERLMEEEGDLFPPQLLGMLPNLEYIAKISGGKIIKGRLPILTN